MLKNITLKNFNLFANSKKLYSSLKSDEYLDNLFGKHKQTNRSKFGWGCGININNNVFEVKYMEMNGYLYADPQDMIEDVEHFMKHNDIITKPQLLIARGGAGYNDKFFEFFQDIEYLDMCNTELYKNGDLDKLFGYISNLKKLKYLFLRNLHIDKIPHNLPESLVYLDIAGNYIKNYENLNNFSNLKALVIGDSVDDKTNEYFNNQIINNIEYLDVRPTYSWRKIVTKINKNQLKFTLNFKNMKHLITDSSQTSYDNYW